MKHLSLRVYLNMRKSRCSLERHNFKLAKSWGSTESNTMGSLVWDELKELLWIPQMMWEGWEPGWDWIFLPWGMDQSNRRIMQQHTFMPFCMPVIDICHICMHFKILYPLGKLSGTYSTMFVLPEICELSISNHTESKHISSSSVPDSKMERPC